MSGARARVTLARTGVVSAQAGARGVVSIACKAIVHGGPLSMPRLAALLTTAVLLVLPTMAAAIEEPAYEVLQRHETFEVRQYAPTVVAEVVVPGPAEEAGNRGFRLLADYIFGNNRGERKIAMTAPVTQAAEPVKFAMTAPVTQAPEGSGHAVRFVMPRAYDLASLPEPVDPRVRLREVKLGPIVVRDVDALVMDGPMGINLLGLAFLKRLEGYAVSGDSLVLSY